ncbi:hypothetical protein HOLleu_03877 [Holothuria leucospilota]|uniref:Uncharacterized protein n=1 Tax=Holothuria leucospilota TaxID=206669 RepID=A0A9Q1CRB3_HOLLE|nr:hypothetical protein HOLleu_03877 [Holothuria leucospilota]
MAFRMRVRLFDRGKDGAKPLADISNTIQRDRAQYMRNYRDRFKNDKPEGYRNFRKIETWRLQQYRQNQTPDQRRRNNEKARLRSLPCNGKNAKRSRQVCRSCKVLIARTSPRKKAAIESLGIQIGQKTDVLESIRSTCRSLKGDIRRHFLWQMSKTYTSRTLNVAYKTLSKYRKLKTPDLRQKRCDSIGSSARQQISEFYHRPGVSTVMPNKKLVKDNEPKRVLHQSLTKTYQSYMKETPSPVSRAKFAQLRPVYVVPHTKAKLYQCLCEYCANVDLKLKSLNHTAAGHKVKYSLLDRYHASDKTVCQYEGNFPIRACLDRDCANCGTSKLEEYLQPLLSTCKTKEVPWQRWGQTTYGQEGKKRVTLQRQRGKLHVLVDELLKEMTGFLHHLFEARWQQMQFNKVIKEPGEKEVIMVMDFAENYQCLMQQEVQSAHWYQAQVTLHPVIAYYKCEEESCENAGPVRECMDIISEDMTHDSHAVAHFVKKAVHHLKERSVPMQKLIQFTDGCSGQYKAKTSFTDISFSNQDLNIQLVERHYFGSRHGKNPCDGEGGVVKNAVSRAVKTQSDVIITDAKTLFEYCKDHLSKPATWDGKCCHSRRSFIFVGGGDIIRNRPSRTDVRTLPGTRKLHAVRGVAPYEVQIRQISCFCCPCRQDQSENCVNKEVVSGWKTQSMKTRDNQPLPSRRGTTEYSSNKEVGSGQMTQSMKTRDNQLVPSTAGTAESNSNGEVLNGHNTQDMKTQDSQSVMPSTGGTAESNSNPELPGNSHTPPSTSVYSEGDFVMVKLPMGKCHATFVAEVLQLLGTEIQLKYMEHVKSNVYKWPTTSDISTEPVECIIQKMPLPTLMESLSSSRVQFFNFKTFPIQ